MGIYREVGKRIRERLLARGYVKSDGELDVERFSWDFRFGRTNLYNWIGDRAVPFKDLLRLCTALECSVEWLLTGKEREMGKGHPRQGRGAARKLLLALSFGAALWPRDGVAGESGILPVFSHSYALPLIRSWRRFRKLFPVFTPGIACA